MSHPATIQTRPGLMSDAWLDPDDNDPLRREPLKVAGQRHYDPLLALHRQSPRTWTEAMVIAGERYRRDYEVGVLGASAAGGRGGTDQPDAHIRMRGKADALMRHEAARAALAETLHAFASDLLVSRLAIKDIASARGRTEDRASALVEAAMLRLVDHYGA